MAAVVNASFASPLANSQYAKVIDNAQIPEAWARITELSGWTIAFTALLVLVAYDQREQQSISKFMKQPLANFFL